MPLTPEQLVRARRLLADGFGYDDIAVMLKCAGHAVRTALRPARAPQPSFTLPLPSLRAQRSNPESNDGTASRVDDARERAFGRSAPRNDEFVARAWSANVPLPRDLLGIPTVSYRPGDRAIGANLTATLMGDPPTARSALAQFAQRQLGQSDE